MGAITSFEQAVALLAPIFAFRGSPEGVRSIMAVDSSQVPTVRGGVLPGNRLVPSEGIMGPESMRLTGAESSYLKLEFFPVHEVPYITALAVFSRPAGVPGTSSGWYVMSCTQSGGWALYWPDPGSSDVFRFIVQRSGSYIVADAPAAALQDTNLAIGTYDGRWLRLYVNGVLVVEADYVSTVPISYSSGDTPILFGTDPDGSGDPTSSAGFTPVDLGVLALCDYGITPTQAAALWDAFSARHVLGGTATLDTGAAADRVVIAGWDSLRRAEVVPASDGAWSADVDAGDYLVTTVGPGGYQPVTHGPVSAVEPG